MSTHRPVTGQPHVTDASKHVFGAGALRLVEYITAQEHPRAVRGDEALATATLLSEQ
jgi:hypothetical protein